MVRADGDALVMHVGEKPIVIAGAKTIDLSSHGLNLSAMVGMLGQLLPADAQASLRELGAVEHRLPPLGADHFSVVAARGGDDIWIEIRRKRELVNGWHPAESVAAAEPAPSEEQIAAVESPVPGAALAEEVPAEPQSAEPVLAAAEEPSADPTPVQEAEPSHDLAPRMEARSEAELASASSAEPPDVDPLADETTLEEPQRLDESVSMAPPSPGDTVEAHPEPLADEAAPALVAPGAPDAPPAVAEVLSPPPESGTTPDIDVPDDDAGATGDESEETEVVEPQPVPVLAFVRGQQHSTSELTRLMASNEAHPQPVPPAGGSGPSAPPGFAAPSPVGDQPPVTRTVRIEVPSRVSPVRAARADQLLRAAATHDASELFVVSQSRPYIRAGGDVQVLADESALQPADVESLLADLTPEPWRDTVRRGEPAEWLIELTGVGRVRCASFRDHRGPGAIFRFVATHPVSAEQLGLGPDAVLLATEPEGLVIVAGPAGSDRSAVVAAFVDTINQRRSDYVITIERQLRTLHENRLALVSQRDTGGDDGRTGSVVQAALRENPDVLVIEDVSTGDVAALALEAAREDRLVIVSLEAPSASAAVQHLVDLLPVDARGAGRAALAQVFRGAIAQLLVRKASGGRVAAREVLTATREVSGLIGHEVAGTLAAALEARHDEGKTPLVDVLAGYVRDGAVDVREAFRKAPDQARLLSALRAAGVDTSTVDRLA